MLEPECRRGCPPRRRSGKADRANGWKLGSGRRGARSARAGRIRRPPPGQAARSSAIAQDACAAGLSGGRRSTAATRAALRDVLGRSRRSAGRAAMEPLEDPQDRECRRAGGAGRRPQPGHAQDAIDSTSTCGKSARCRSACRRPTSPSSSRPPARSRADSSRTCRFRAVASSRSWRLSLANEVDLLRATILRTLVDRLAAEPSRALPHALALQAMDPANSGLAAEVKAMAESARELAVKAPKAGRPSAALPGVAPHRRHRRSSTANVRTSRSCRSRSSVRCMALRPWPPTWCFGSWTRCSNWLTG